MTGRPLIDVLAEAGLLDMPNQPRTPARAVRVGVLWDEARAVATRRGETMTAVVIRALRRYVETNGHD
jgi:hypothetical protein